MACTLAKLASKGWLPVVWSHSCTNVCTVGVVSVPLFAAMLCGSACLSCVTSAVGFSSLDCSTRKSSQYFTIDHRDNCRRFFALRWDAPMSSWCSMWQSRRRWHSRNNLGRFLFEWWRLCPVAAGRTERDAAIAAEIVLHPSKRWALGACDDAIVHGTEPQPTGQAVQVKVLLSP